MTPPSQAHPEDSDLLEALAEFRFQLRNFLHLSEQAAEETGLHPQQHQLLLQIAGAPPEALTTIAYAAERLGLRHHSVVELANRSVGEGLLVRSEDAEDRRRVILSISGKGRSILQSLSTYHRRELRVLGPHLIRALKHIEKLDSSHLASSPRRPA